MNIAKAEVLWVPYIKGARPPHERQQEAVPITLEALAEYIREPDTEFPKDKNYMPVFFSHRREDGEPTGLQQLDFDTEDKSPIPDMSALRAAQIAAGHYPLIFKSPSGGLKSHIYIPDVGYDVETRKRALIMSGILMGGLPVGGNRNYIGAGITAQSGILKDLFIDTGVMNEGRLCYINKDPDAYFNPNPIAMDIPDAWIEGKVAYDTIAAMNAENEPDWGNGGVRLCQVLHSQGYNDEVVFNAFWLYSRAGTKIDTDDALRDKMRKHLRVKDKYSDSTPQKFNYKKYLQDSDARLHSTRADYLAPDIPNIPLSARPFKVERDSQGIPSAMRVQVLNKMEKQVKHEVQQDLYYYWSPVKNAWLLITDATATMWNIEFNSLTAVVEHKQVKTKDGWKTQTRYTHSNATYQNTKNDIEALGNASPFSYFQEYLLGIPEWDKQERLGSLIPTLFQVSEDHSAAYLEYASKLIYWTIAARNLCDLADTVDSQVSVVLAGEPNAGKSNFTSGIVDDKYFTDDFSMDAKLDGEKRFESIQGKIVVEWGEMAGARRADWETAKAFLTRQVDTYRMKYNRFIKNYPRRNIIIGTVNSDNFELPPTPAVWRRLCIVNIEGRGNAGDPYNYLLRHREQLFAEAVHLYKNNLFQPNPELNGVEDELMAIAEHYTRERLDLKSALRLTLTDKTHITDDDVLTDLSLGYRLSYYTRSEYRFAMKSLGWVQKRTTYRGKRDNFWVKE